MKIKIVLVLLISMFAFLSGYENTLEIRTEFPEVNVNIDGKYVGNGSVTKKFDKGKYDLMIKKKGYKSLVKEIEVKGQDLFLYELESISALVKIKSEPESGADINIDGKIIGKTPFYDAEFDAGTYRVEIRKEGWLTERDTISVEPEVKFEKTYQLTENAGFLTIDAPGSDIYIKGQNVGRNKLNVKLSPGKINVSARKKNHYDDSKQIEIKLGENSSCKLNPLPITGKVNVSAKTLHDNTLAKGLSIFCNESDSGEKTTSSLELMIGEYEISLQHSEYPEVSKKIKIEEKDNESLIFDVESYSWYRNKANKWEKHTWIGLTTSAVLAGSGFLSNMQANDNFDKYEGTGSTSEAMDYKQKTRDFENYRDYCYYAASGAAVYTLYSWIKTAVYGKKLKDK